MDPYLLPVLFAMDAVALALGVWFLHPRPQLRLSSLVLRTLGYGGAVACVWLTGTRLVWQDGFAGLLALVHACFFVVLPLCGYVGVRLLLRPDTGARLLGASGLLLCVLGGLVYVQAHWIEPFDLEITRELIRTGRVQQRIRIVVLSDLQCEEIGAFEREVFRAIAEEEPDLLLLPGDFLQARGEAYAREREKLAAAFAALPTPRLGTYAVYGDADDSAVTLAGTGIPVLGDGTRRLAPESRLALITLSSGASRAPLTEAHFAALGDFDGLPIVMGHAPDYMNNVLLGNVHREMLCIAGHTHGGQVQLPGFGPPITLSRVPRWLAAGGLFQRHGAWLLVSRGVGMERHNAPRLRLNCRPQLFVVTLVPEEPVARGG